MIPLKMQIGGLDNPPIRSIVEFLMCTTGAGTCTRTQDLAGRAVISNVLAIRAMPELTILNLTL